MDTETTHVIGVLRAIFPIFAFLSFEGFRQFGIMRVCALVPVRTFALFHEKNTRKFLPNITTSLDSVEHLHEIPKYVIKI